MQILTQMQLPRILSASAGVFDTLMRAEVRDTLPSHIGRSCARRCETLALHGSPSNILVVQPRTAESPA